MREKFNEYYLQFRNNRIFKTAMHTHFVIACAVFLAYAVVMVFNVYNAGSKQLMAAEQKMLTQAETTNDFILRNITATATYVYENEPVALDAMSKPYSPRMSLQVSELISEMKSRSNAIDKVYFFNLNNNCIYTADNPVYTQEDFPDRELLQIIADTGQYSVNMPHILKYEENGVIKEQRTLLSIYKYSNTTCMAVFIDSDFFNSLVNVGTGESDQDMIILQSDGTVLSSTIPDLFGTNMAEDKVAKRLLAEPNQSGHINHRGKIYCYRKSNTLNSLYLAQFKASSVIVSYLWQFTIILLFAILLLVLYLISSIQLSISVFRPFKKLRSDVFDILGIDSDMENTGVGTDKDLELISKNLANIRREYDLMHENEDLYSASKQNELVYNILTGAYNYDENELLEYNINFKYPYTTVILVRLDNTKNIERSNIAFMLYNLANAGTEVFTGNGLQAYHTTYCNEYDIVFIVNHQMAQFDTNRIRNLQKYAAYALNTTVSAAYETGSGGIDAVAQLYLDSKFSMQYRIVKGHDSIISYKALISSISTDYAYPLKHEKAVVREINQKNQEAASAAVNAFVDTIAKMPLMYIITHTATLMMTIGNHTPSDKSEDASAYNIITDDLTKLETLDEYRELLISMTNNAIIAASDVKLDDKHVMIANSIEQYINDHFTDPNLSIDVIATYVNKSANYTRTIFKQNKGISISDYITKIRFDEVCRLLRETNLTAQAIGAKAGMSSGSYFYTSFKKYTGFTPEQYRKKYMQS